MPAKHLQFIAAAAAKHSQFIAVIAPSKHLRFVTAPPAKHTRFLPTALSAAPSDVTLSVTADCLSVRLTVARDWTEEGTLSASALAHGAPAGSDGTPANIEALVTADGVKAVVTFLAPADGVYEVAVTSDSGQLLRLGLPVLCRAYKCLRTLNRPLATSGRNGQAAASTDESWEPWEQVYARTRLVLAACATADYASAQQLIESLAPYCSTDGCGCASCS